jgi:hypothetical protein
MCAVWRITENLWPVDRDKMSKAPPSKAISVRIEASPNIAA